MFSRTNGVVIKMNWIPVFEEDVRKYQIVSSRKNVDPHAFHIGEHIYDEDSEEFYELVSRRDFHAEWNR